MHLKWETDGAVSSGTSKQSKKTLSQLMRTSSYIFTLSVLLAKVRHKEVGLSHFSIGCFVKNFDCMIGSRTSKSMWLHYSFV